MSRGTQRYTVLGVMSGTSLDGLDLALVSFEKHGGRWRFRIVKAETVPYSHAWKERLSRAFHTPPDEVGTLDTAYGKWMAGTINSFLSSVMITPDFIASHGHTVFHQPERGITRQVGDGGILSATTGIPVISNFRTEDVRLGGQGAPLVPVGDRDLFGDYDYCLNLGGIANISYDKAGQRLAHDICPFNMGMNYLAGLLGKPFDKEGAMARSGSVRTPLMDALNAIPYYETPPPKSLGYENFKEHWLPVLKQTETPVRDQLATYIEHTAHQISRLLRSGTKASEVLVTGGGAFNRFFIERLQAMTPAKIVLPEKEVIGFKEALVFAYLGILRLEGRVNCLATVTGASRDNMGGELSGF